MKSNLLLSALLCASTFAADPLPSWNEGAAKQSITAFVEKVTKVGTPDFVPVAERIATFDNDGTLTRHRLNLRRISRPSRECLHPCRLYPQGRPDHHRQIDGLGFQHAVRLPGFPARYGPSVSKDLAK